MRRVLIVGATSAIAEATARRFAKEGDRLFLTGRDVGKLERIAQDLRIRGATQVDTHRLDVTQLSAHEAALARAEMCLGGLDTVLIAHGTLPDQRECEKSVELSVKEFNTNGLSAIALLTRLASKFEQKRSGTIAVITSVAGDRGRQSNYIYGSAKGALSTFLQGLRNRLSSLGVHVLTIKPGFVDTPMTATFKKGPLWASPDRVARDILNAIGKRKDVIYTPWFWRPIMLVIRLIPERVFKRMRL
jgi:short-subunit dehydrogenase